MPRIIGTRDRPFRYYLVALIVVATVPLLPLIIILMVNYIASERGHLQSYVRDTNGDILSALDRDLTAKISLLRGLATSGALNRDDFDEFDRQARDLVASEGFNIDLRHLSGTQVVNTRFVRGVPLPKGPASGDRKVPHRERPDVSDLLYADKTGEHIIRVSIPITRGGEVVYFLSARFTPGYFAALLTAQNLDPLNYAVIADRSGRIIAASERTKTFEGASLTGFNEMMGAGGTWSGAGMLGESVFRSYRRSALSGWIVTTSVDYAALDAPLHRSLWLFLVFFLAVTMVVLGASAILSRRMSASFGALTDGAKQLGEGAVVAFRHTRIREANVVGRALELASAKIHETSDAVRRVNEDLDHLVDKRTRKLRATVDELRAAHEETETARVAAVEANEAKSLFLASMSHELRTPLNAISGFAQLLFHSGDGLKRDRLIRYAQNIMDGSESLKKIIDDVLDMARIETGQISLNCEALDGLEIMTEVYRTLEGAAKEQGILFTFDTSVFLPSVFADRGRLIQVLLNLGSNAIKYNIDGGWVVFTAYPHEGMVRFLVRDTGLGIAPAHHDRVFATFDRLGAEQGPVEGVGIGLAISRRLVHAMHGDIGFDSQEGTGSSFWIDLPIASDAAARTTPSQTALPALAGDSSFTILYIEDRLANVELMRSIMEDLDNSRLIDAQTVQEGIRLARSAKPDLIITDIHLPDGTGFNVLEQVRKDPKTAHIPVMALTADAMPINMDNMRQHGFDHIMTKPLRLPELMDTVRTTRKAA